MTNAVFTTGPLTKEVSEKVNKHRFVELDGGKVKHATGTALPYGYVRQSAAPEAPREDNDLSYGLPKIVAVVTHQAVVLVDTDDDSIKAGDKVYAAADGKAAKSGTVVVGLAERDSSGNTVRVHMFHPAALNAAE